MTHETVKRTVILDPGSDARGGRGKGPLNARTSKDFSCYWIVSIDERPGHVIGLETDNLPI